MALKQRELCRKNKRKSIPSRTIAGFTAKRLLWLWLGNKVVFPKLLTQNTTVLKQTCKEKAKEAVLPAVTGCDWPSFSECQCQAKRLPKLTSFNQGEHQVKAKQWEHRFFFNSIQWSVALCKINFEASYFYFEEVSVSLFAAAVCALQVWQAYFIKRKEEQLFMLQLMLHDLSL